MVDRKFETGALEAERQAKTTKPPDGQLTEQRVKKRAKVVELATRVGVLGENDLFRGGVGMEELVGLKGEIDVEALRNAGGEELVRRVTDWLYSRPISSAPWSSRTKEANKKGPQGRFSNNGRGRRRRGTGRYAKR